MRNNYIKWSSFKGVGYFRDYDRWLTKSRDVIFQDRCPCYVTKLRTRESGYKLSYDMRLAN